VSKWNLKTGRFQTSQKKTEELHKGSGGPWTDGGTTNRPASGHTPGPWEATNLDDEEFFPSVFIGPELRYFDSSDKFRDSIVINVGPTPENVKMGEGGGTTLETARANARLIAAAPEMVAFIESLADKSTIGGYSDILVNARALLARIEGK